MNSLKTEENGKKKIVRPHMGRIVFFILLYGASLFFYFFLYGYLSLLILILLTALPVISLVSVWFLARFCEVRLTVSGTDIIRGEPFLTGILIKNPTVFTTFHVGVKLQAENTFYRTGTEVFVSMPMVPRGESRSELSFVPDRNGIVKIKVAEIQILDFCGLISVVLPFSFEQSVNVLPEKEELEEAQKAGIYAGMADNEEDVSKGNDFADTSNIREYVPGDRMKDIHWKLSAKKDYLLVKERIRMAENQLTVWLQPGENPEQTDEVLKLCYNLIRLCIGEGILIKLLWHGGRAIIGSGADLREAFLSVYASGTEQGNRTEGMVLADENRPVRTFVRVGWQGVSAEAVVVEYDV